MFTHVNRYRRPGECNERSLPENEVFFSDLNILEFTDTDSTLAKRVCKDFEIKNLAEYHDLYVQSDTLSLVDLLNNFHNTCLQIYKLDSAHFLFAPGLLTW